MTFDKKHKEIIHYIVAVLSFLLAGALSLIGMYSIPEGEISGGALTAILQFLSATLAIFGITVFGKTIVRDEVKKVIKEEDDHQNQN